jgi:hypothetical protein
MSLAYSIWSDPALRLLTGRNPAMVGYFLLPVTRAGSFLSLKRYLSRTQPQSLVLAPSPPSSVFWSHSTLRPNGSLKTSPSTQPSSGKVLATSFSMLYLTKPGRSAANRSISKSVSPIMPRGVSMKRQDLSQRAAGRPITPALPKTLSSIGNSSSESILILRLHHY